MLDNVVSPEIGREGDASALFALREDAANWMQRRGIQQWAPGEVTLDEIADQLRRREWFVVRDGDTVAAALRILETDDAVWGSQPGEALYVHGLVVHRQHVGRALGRQLLEWVEDLAVKSNRMFVRLACAECNAELRGYYRAVGYEEVGRREFSGRWLPATLFEKRLIFH